MRSLRTLLLGLVAVVALPGATAGAAQLSWTPCFSSSGPFECSTMQAPLDYANPHGEHITLALVKLPATDRAHRIGSLFVNPGGPGGSGVDFVVGAGQTMLTPEVRARFDIVGFDPRGIARSTPLRCFFSVKGWTPVFIDFAFPTSRQQFDAWVQADLYLDQKCVDHAGPIVSHMSTANVARDLDRMRAAVGDAGLSYDGYSYGSVLGATYANLFPSRVRALIVDGVVDQQKWYGVDPADAALPIFNRIQSSLGSQATLDEFFRLCDAGGPNCAFGPDSAARFASLAARLQAHPQVVTVAGGSVLLDYTNLVSVTLSQLYFSPGWEAFAQDLNDIDGQVSAARLGADLARLRVPVGALDPQLGTFKQLRRYSNAIEGQVGVACADAPHPDRLRDLLERGHRGPGAEPLRDHLDLDRLAVRRVAIPARPGPLYGQLHRLDGEPGPHRRQHVRPGDADRRCRGAGQPAAELAAADDRRLGAHVVRRAIVVRLRGAGQVPDRRNAAPDGHGLRAGPRAVLRMTCR